MRQRGLPAVLAGLDGQLRDDLRMEVPWAFPGPGEQKHVVIDDAGASEARYSPA
jgi:hypothetical protein